MFLFLFFSEKASMLVLLYILVNTRIDANFCIFFLLLKFIPNFDLFNRRHFQLNKATISIKGSDIFKTENFQSKCRLAITPHLINFWI